MNLTTDSGIFARLAYRATLATRHLGSRRTRAASGDGAHKDSIGRIYVLNLDRQKKRWERTRRELARVRDRNDRPLTEIARRFSAVDARYYLGPQSDEDLIARYTLADQLAVEPNALLSDRDAASHIIEMTRQEAAVARSHVAIWKAVAAGDQAYVLILEDDVYFRRKFASALDAAWAALMNHGGRPEVVYLSYKETRKEPRDAAFSPLLFRPRGMWQLSGYVLSRAGAAKLLTLLPVRGPVDLWINHHFGELETYATQTSIVEQRRDSPSDNSYSILPVLSRLGVHTSEKPLIPKARALPGPVFALGDHGTGHTALAMALSMLGYRCCSDVSELPPDEQHNLLSGNDSRVFDAYVNVGSLDVGHCSALSRLYPRARFIFTQRDIVSAAGARCEPRDALTLPAEHPDKWELVCRFLGCDYPSDRFPECADQPQRALAEPTGARNGGVPQPTRLKADSSPWIVPAEHWRGIALADVREPVRSAPPILHRGGELDTTRWLARDDTFPSNLALFVPRNVSAPNGATRLSLRNEVTTVRAFTSGAICSRQRYLYGRFVAELRPAQGAGLITGVFLHRDAPRQEIDLEFLGKDTTKILTNVYYNPGTDGARMQYGYRGTPALVDLGFDAAHDFHRYEIEWSPSGIRWLVDGRVVCQRVSWAPTPIPHLPMQFNVNLWPSRSEELAGPLATRTLVADTDVKALEIHSSEPELVFPPGDHFRGAATEPRYEFPATQAEAGRVVETPASSCE